MNTLSTKLKKDASGAPYAEVNIGMGVAVLRTTKEIEEVGRAMAEAFVAVRRFGGPADDSLSEFDFLPRTTRV